MAKIFESKGLGSAESFVQAGRRLEGFLLPETYALSRHADAPRLVHEMNQAFEHALTPEIRAAADARGLTIQQLVTLASIVEKETGDPAERPIVASGVRKPSAHRHGAAVRPDRDLCARARGPVRRQHSPRRFVVRLAVQHLPVSPDCHRARLRRRASPRSTPWCIQPSRITCTSSAGMTDRMCLRRPWRNTIRTSSAIRSSTSGRQRRGGQEGRERRDTADTEFPILPILPLPSILSDFRSSLSPFQFLAQDFEVASCGRSNEPHGLSGAADADLVAGMQLETRLAVERDEHLVAFFQHRLSPAPSTTMG